MEVAAVTARMAMDEQPVVQAFKRAGVAAVEYKTVTVAQMEAAGKQGTASIRQELHHLEENFGRRSALGLGLRLGLEGGAIGLAAHAFGELTDKIAGAAKELREGDKSASEIVGTLLREVPIIGDLTKGFDNIREAITGEKQAIELVNEEARLTVKYFDDQVAAAKTLRNTIREYADEIARANAAAREASIRDTTEKKITGLRDEQEAQWKKDMDDLDKRIKDEQDQINKTKRDAGAIADNLRAQFVAQFGTFDPTLQNVNLLASAAKRGKPNDEEFQVVKQLNFTVPNSEDFREQMTTMIMEINNAELMRQQAVRRGEQEIQKIKDEASKAALAHDAEYNAKILEAQREGGAKLAETTKERLAMVEKQMEEARRTELEEIKSQAEKLRVAYEESPHAEFERLADPAVPATEVFGTHTVTSHDTFPMHEEVDALKEANGYLSRIADLIAKQGQNQGAGPTIDVLNSSSW